MVVPSIDQGFATSYERRLGEATQMVWPRGRARCGGGLAEAEPARHVVVLPWASLAHTCRRAPRLWERCAPSEVVEEGEG